jgi:hypothetical protein
VSLGITHPLAFVGEVLRRPKTKRRKRDRRKRKKSATRFLEADMRAFAIALSLLLICQSSSALVYDVASTPEVENRFFLDIVEFVTLRTKFPLGKMSS